nr:hypothetical protein Iba_chr07cCG9770 [Ipomoea batatas]
MAKLRAAAVCLDRMHNFKSLLLHHLLRHLSADSSYLSRRAASILAGSENSPSSMPSPTYPVGTNALLEYMQIKLVVACVRTPRPQQCLATAALTSLGTTSPRYIKQASHVFPMPADHILPSCLRAQTGTCNLRGQEKLLIEGRSNSRIPTKPFTTTNGTEDPRTPANLAVISQLS